MANPSLIFTISFLIFIAILFLISTFTGWLVKNKFVLPALLVFTAWGFCLWLVIGYYGKWVPYSKTKNNRDKSIFTVSLIFLCLTTVLFVTLLILAIIYHPSPKNVSRVRAYRRYPRVTDIAPPTVPVSVPASRQTSAPLSAPASAPMDLVKEVNEEKEYLSTIHDPNIQSQINLDIQQKTDQINMYETQGLLTPEQESLATRIAQDKINRANESLSKPYPSVYFTQKPMFGQEGQNVLM